MDNLIQFLAAAGLNLYAVVFRGGQAWNGSAFEAVVSGDQPSYALAMSESATGTGLYQVAFPAAIPAGEYSVAIYRRIGASPAATDPSIGLGPIGWTGSALAPAGTGEGITGLSPFVPFPSQCFPSLVTLQRTPDTVSTRGAGNPGTATTAVVTASVVDKATVQRQLNEQGGASWQSVTSGTASFATDPALRAGDSILDDLHRILNVTCDSRRVGGWQNLFRVAFEQVRNF